MAKTDSQIREAVANSNNKNLRLLLMILIQLERLEYDLHRILASQLYTGTQDDWDECNPHNSEGST